MTNPLAIDVSQLTKDIKGERILDHVNFQVGYGEMVGIVGPNGAGKSLLLRLLCGLAYPTAGQIIIEGHPLKRGTFPDQVGVIIETPGFLPHLSGWENLMLLAQIRRRIVRSRVEETLDRLGLHAAQHKPVRHYSLGMKQRLGIAQAIMENPHILLLDEPMNGLDPQGVDRVLDILGELRQAGIAIVWVSHDLPQLVQWTDRVMQLHTAQLHPWSQGSQNSDV